MSDPALAMEELRKAVANLCGYDEETWPTHGNAPLAIGATVALLAAGAKKTERLRKQLEAKDAALRNALAHINRWRRAGVLPGAEGFVAEAAAQSIAAVLGDCLTNPEELP